MPFHEPRARLSVSMVKNQNRQLVFRQIFRKSPVTRAEIVQETGLSQGTVKTIVDEFLAAGVVEETKDVRAPVGRKPHKVSLNPETRTLGILSIQPERAELFRLNLLLEPTGPPESLMLTDRKNLEDKLRKLIAKAAVQQGGLHGRMVGVGASVPGAYHADGDRIVCHIMPELNHIHLKTLIEEITRTPTVVGEDVHVAALAETRHPYSVPQPLFYLYAGTGVGGSFVTDGDVLLGATKMAGEIGQIQLDKETRLEDAISWPWFLERCGVPHDPLEEQIVGVVRELLDRGESRAVAARDAVLDHLTPALESVICILNPRTIVIGGPYGELGEHFLDPLRHRVLPRLISEHAASLEIVAARGGTMGVIRGAAFAVLERWLETEFSVGGDQ